MSLFQNSVLNKYLKGLDEGEVSKSYKTFTNYFHDSDRQENIRNSKEEQFQEGFLRELFVNVFGYVLNPDPGYNLTTELKNIRGTKKVDGAILSEGIALAVIELKGTNTKDLEAVRQQAFDYKANQKGCIYVITSNFEKLRFYIGDAVDFLEFDLFKLGYEDFRVLYLCLSSSSLLRNTPQIVKSDSIIEEDEITKKFYKAYSLFKWDLYRDLVKKNTKTEVFREESNCDDKERAKKNIELSLFKKSQKLIDRFLFVFFSEDRGLLPPNTTAGVISEWKKLVELDVDVSLYERFKQFFSYLDQGRKGTEKKEEIFAYNGGLFKLDPILDSLVISDEILERHAGCLSGYNFESQVDVNILGHIFENSLNEIESVNAQIEGYDFDKQTAKRKKDGVFYTPPYITKYIVENTIGKLCEKMRNEFGVDESEYRKSKKGRKKDTLIKYKGRLDDYRDWLLGVTICDPACGSGAFLNQALNFLIKEHRYIDELESALLGGGIVFQNVETTILENNIFGVDINEESVELAKLSLWLRTAQPRRKLNDLSNNIKCGNSLVKCKSLAGEKAFDWESEFPAVFDKGGFDIVIGNPPYVFTRDKISEAEKGYYSANYLSAVYQVNTYLLFIEKTVHLLKNSGIYGLIVPNAWLMVYSGSGLRKFLLDTSKLNQIISLEGYSFEGVNVETVILLAEKEFVEKNEFSVHLSDKKEFLLSHHKDQKEFYDHDDYAFKVFSDSKSQGITDKITSGSVILDSIVSIKAGLQAYEKGKGEPKQTAEDVKARPYDYTYKHDDDTHKYLVGADVCRYHTDWSGEYLKYGKNLAAPRTFDLFNGKKIIVREITGKHPRSIISTYTEDLYLYNRSNIAIIEKEGSAVSLKYILAVLNSSLMSYYFKRNTAKANRKMFPKVILKDLRQFPFKMIDDEGQKPFIEMVDKMLELSSRLSLSSSTFTRYITSTLSITSPSSSLRGWYDLDFKGFIDEIADCLKREKLPKMSKSDGMDWLGLFDENKDLVKSLQNEIRILDSKINTLVYDLYGLTEQEIALVEAG
ncbi:Eco57I restriction-modification methylase domain-containing protein [Pseudomonas sp.]|uniref:Eco57I restriction-modification methylase domain-containing protein n=1 Tax=Pseudomonas sp. TaxID=306 RepID=UPI003CC5324E